MAKVPLHGLAANVPALGLPNVLADRLRGIPYALARRANRERRGKAAGYILVASSDLLHLPLVAQKPTEPILTIWLCHIITACLTAETSLNAQTVAQTVIS